MILLIDNYDSFTYNLVDYFQQIGAECVVVRNHCPVADLPKNVDGVVLSPGPGRPKEAGRLMEYIAYYHKKVPMLGVCLGHQLIGYHFGGQVDLVQPEHAKLWNVKQKGESVLFKDMPEVFSVARYHSMVLSKNNFPDDGLGIVPDFFVRNSIDDVLEGKDAVMEFTQGLIQQSIQEKN